MGQQAPQLVICDLLMPEMDGYEVVERLQANEATRDATILILTAHELSSADRERLYGKVAAVLAKCGDPRPALARWLRRAAEASQRRALIDGKSHALPYANCSVAGVLTKQRPARAPTFRLKFLHEEGRGRTPDCKNYPSGVLSRSQDASAKR